MRRNTFVNVCLAIIVASSVLYFSEKGFLKKIELITLDFFFQMKGQNRASDKIVIIEVDTPAIKKIGRWPWPRTYSAEMVEALKFFGAKQMFFDLLYTEPSVEEEDDALKAALEQTDNVYFPFAFVSGEGEKEIVNPIDKFRPYLKGTGFINATRDIDGKIRRSPLFFSLGPDFYTHAALTVSMDYLGMRLKRLTHNFLIIGNEEEEISLPLSDENKMLINWYGKYRYAFARYSFPDVLEAYQAIKAGKPSKLGRDIFKDKLCMVGITAVALHDNHAVPVQAVYPGIGVVATLIENIISRDYLKVIPKWVDIFIIYLLALIPAFLILDQKPLREVLSLFFVLLVFLISYFLFLKNYRMYFSYPLISLVASYLILSLYNFARIDIENKRMMTLVITDELTGLSNIRHFKMELKSACLMARMDPQKTFCIIMTDVDNFKSFNDVYGHQTGDLVLSSIAKALKNSVRIQDVVSRYGGEEMIIMLRGVNLENGQKIAETVRKNVASLVLEHENEKLQVTVSVGIACFDPQKDDGDSVIKKADDAMYHAKKTGKNKVCAFSPSLELG